MNPNVKKLLNSVVEVLINANRLYKPESGVYKELLQEVVTECESRLEALEQDEMKRAIDSLRQEIENENV